LARFVSFAIVVVCRVGEVQAHFGDLVGLLGQKSALDGLVVDGLAVRVRLFDLDFLQRRFLLDAVQLQLKFVDLVKLGICFGLAKERHSLESCVRGNLKVVFLLAHERLVELRVEKALVGFDFKRRRLSIQKNEFKIKQKKTQKKNS
jgi:hypothetical protein